jgi:hypothetical protein
VCSRNICDIYLGRIERQLFTFSLNELTTANNTKMILQKSNEIILRVVDDYLAISYAPHRLNRIKELLKSRLLINDDKTVYHHWTPTIFNNKNTKHLQSIENKVSSQSTDDISFLKYNSNNHFTWCGLNFDTKTLDVYYNYDKYFECDLYNRLNNHNSEFTYKYKFMTFNLKFLRLFNMNISDFMINTKANSLQAIIRGFVDAFALSVARFIVMYKTQLNELIPYTHLQMKLILNCINLADRRISNDVRRDLTKYFYSTIILFRYLCFRTYSVFLSKLINKSRKFANFKYLLRSINKILDKYCDFYESIRSDNNRETIQCEINQLIDEQLKKFYKCQF